MRDQKSPRSHSPRRRSSLNATEYRLTVLGASTLAHTPPGRVPLNLLGPGKLLGLLSYLALAPGRHARVDALIDLLWSGRNAVTAAHDLRQAIWKLRRVLGPGAITCARGEVVLQAALAVDRDEFVAALDQGALGRAVALYGGEFLAGVVIKGEATFDHWATAEGYRLRRLFGRAAEALAREALAAGRVPDALRLARRVRDADSEDEEAWVLLLETLLAMGDPVRAAAEADLFERVLERDGRTPAPETRALVRRARFAAEHGATYTPSALPAAALVGRERELEALLGAWQWARRGTGRHLHVVGATGLGKTTLLREVETRLRAAGERVLYLGARFPVQRVLFGFLSELVTALAELPGALGVSPAAAAALVALNPALSGRFAVAPDPVREEEALRHRAQALRELIAAVSEEAPLALLCDDLQWACPASVEALAWAFGSLDTTPALCITAATPEPDGGVPSTTTARMELRPWSAEQVQDLLRSLAPLPDAPWATSLAPRLHEASGGSPRTVLELLERAFEEGWLYLGASGWTCTDSEELLQGLPLAAAPAPGAIVILPFAVEGADDANPVGAILTEGLTTDLSRVARLRVTALGSAMRLGAGPDSLQETARRVGARHVVHGTVEGTPDRLRVTVGLWDAANGMAIREEVMTGSPAEVPNLRARLGQAVVEGLGLRLSPRDARTLGPRTVGEMHAHECWLRARQCIVRFIPEELERALRILRHGLEVTGESALLYAAMGMVYWNLVHSGSNPDDSLVRRAEEYAAKALELDPELPQGYVLAGLIARMQRRPQDAVALLRRALALDPNSPDGLFWLATCYGFVGRSFAAQVLADRLLELDPLTAMNLALPAIIAMTDGRHQDAPAAFQRASDLDPNPTGRVIYAISLARAEQIDRAHAEFDRLVRDAPDAFATRLGTFLQCALRGDRASVVTRGPATVEPAAQWVEYLAWHTAAGYSLVGESDWALTWLDRAASLGLLNYPFLMTDPLLARIRGEAGFTQLAERVKRAWEAFEV